ncbi:PREDICTED: aspartic proteinase-like protein 1 [Camelina sativa]|uniref:Aspartic proteinase-like protein 1 n=1 Tax=Camelina sativa TaxID=90675 RepID=A0ABM0XVM6_CAMSA|nr:PREDICTED: aspartic proteinase-like protein 1 [Camelina sativa]
MASRSGSTFLLLCVLVLATEQTLASVFSSRLIHRFSDEARASIKIPRSFPEKRSLEYYQLLARSDFRRQRMNLGAKSQPLVPSEGSKTISSGNDFGWLHYTWIDIGTPSVSFLVALDTGSDLLWIPCNCVQCAPLTATYYSSLATKDLNEYNPSTSSTSKVFLCSHKLCDSAPDCESPKEQCPYTVNYLSGNTSTSGLLVEDILHLTYNTNNRLTNASSSVKAQVVLGCGKKQSGDYLTGVAPDGLMGLGLGDISVPSFLSKAGIMRNSFSLCFDEEDSGRIYFGDMGPSVQQSTQFLPVDNKYIVGVETCCVGNSCLKQTSFRTYIDSGQSFTYLPEEIYRKVAVEMDRHINATMKSFEDVSWEYCYESSVEPKVPAIKLRFSHNNTFVIHKPLFVFQQSQGLVQFCLPISSSGEEGIRSIGQNYMRGNRMVFDRENMKLGWSASKCQENEIEPPQVSPGSTSAPYPLPTEEQQSRSHAVSPAIAGKTPSKTPSSSSPSRSSCSFSSMMRLFNSLLLLHGVVSYM